MTAEVLCDLLTPLIGKSGSISMVVARIGQIGLMTAENKGLTGAEVRPDGLVRLEREGGWVVLDPAEVVAVAWNGDTEKSVGQFL
jgi:hypothetical protein